MKVLVVEDSTLVRERLLAMLLDRASVDTAEGAEGVREALTALRRKPDAVILDIHMPEGNSLDVLRAAKRLRPAPCVIVLTNYPELHYKRKYIEEGADYFYDKSTQFDQAVAQVERLQETV